MPSLFFPAIMIGMKRDKRTTTPNEHIEITITGLGSSGEGVGKVKGFTYFIPGALPGERVTAAVTAKKKNYGLTLGKDPGPQSGPNHTALPCL